MTNLQPDRNQGLTNLQPAKDDALLMALSNGKVIMGLWPVLFGWRVRAGTVGAMWYHMDWCCGDDAAMIWATYDMMKYLLENRDINTLKPHSEIKPWYRDKEFSDWLVDQIKPWKHVHVIVNRPSLDELRTEYMSKLGRLGEDIPHHHDN